ncbi:MAG: LppX_LprAFG lipoprotein [SAR202 cluster bacterium]|nr:LppX_LprAFG lipoprotein [SAR202 cluster bacterium]
MTCAHIDELLAAHVNDELPRTQREFVDRHLDDCTACRASHVSQTWVRRRLTTLRDVPPGAEIRDAAMSRIMVDASKRWHTRPMIRPVLFALVIVAAVAVPLALRFSGAGPDARIAEAYDAVQSLQTYHMSGTTTTNADGETGSITFEWEFVAPDRYRGEITGPAMNNEFVIVGSDQYLRSSTDGGSFQSVVMSEDLLNPIPSRGGVLKLLATMSDLLEQPHEIIEGVDTRHITGKIDFGRHLEDQLTSLDPSSPEYDQAIQWIDLQRSTRIGVEVWVAKTDSSLRQMRLDVSSPMIRSGPAGIQQIGTVGYITDVRYYDFDKAIEIEPPISDSGALEPGWVSTNGGMPAPTAAPSLSR